MTTPPPLPLPLPTTQTTSTQRPKTVSPKVPLPPKISPKNPNLNINTNFNTNTNININTNTNTNPTAPSSLPPPISPHNTKPSSPSPLSPLSLHSLNSSSSPRATRSSSTPLSPHSPHSPHSPSPLSFSPLSPLSPPPPPLLSPSSTLRSSSHPSSSLPSSSLPSSSSSSSSLSSPSSPLPPPPAPAPLPLPTPTNSSLSSSSLSFQSPGSNFKPPPIVSSATFSHPNEKRKTPPKLPPLPPKNLNSKNFSSSFSSLPSSPLGRESSSSSSSLLPSPLRSPLPPSLVLSDSEGEEKKKGEEEKIEGEQDQEKVGRMRMNIVKEIIDTETDYISDIQVLIQVFKSPIKEKNLIPGSDLQAIFSNIEDVVPIHQTFLMNLEQKLLEQKESGGAEHEVVFGDIFVRFFHYFKLYSIYASNQNVSLAKLEDWSKKKEFDNFLKTCYSDERCKGQFLNSYLIKPIQRLCKYPLLLRELIKYTPESHPDAVVLTESADKVNSVVNFVNEAKRKEENLQRMRAISEKFGIKDLVREDRILIKEGKVFQKKGGKNEDRYLFVFNDLVLVMKPTKRGNEKDTNEKLHFKKIASADLSRAKIVNIADLPEKDIKSAFEVILDGETILFSTSTEKEKNVWVKTINACIKEFQRQTAFKLKKEQQAKKKEIEEREKEKKEKEEKRNEEKLKAKLAREAISFEDKKSKMSEVLTSWSGSETLVNENPEDLKKKKMESALSSWTGEGPNSAPAIKRRSTMTQGNGETRKSHTNLMRFGNMKRTGSLVSMSHSKKNVD